MLKKPLPKADREALAHGGKSAGEKNEFRRGERVLVQWNQPSADGAYSEVIRNPHYQ
jgi:hypothetical protein